MKHSYYIETERGVAQGAGEQAGEWTCNGHCIKTIRKPAAGLVSQFKLKEIRLTQDEGLAVSGSAH